MSGFPTQFQHTLDRMLGGGFLHQHTHFIGTCEGNEVDVFVRGQAGAGFLAQPGDHIEYAGRQACFQRQFCHPDYRQAGIFGWLNHTCIAHRQRWRNTSAYHLRRIVPGNDMCSHTQRLSDGLDRVAVQKGNHLAMHLVGGGTIELKIAGHHLDIVSCRGNGLAGILGFQLGQLFCVLQNQSA